MPAVYPTLTDEQVAALVAQWKEIVGQLAADPPGSLYRVCAEQWVGMLLELQTLRAYKSAKEAVRCFYCGSTTVPMVDAISCMRCEHFYGQREGNRK